MSGEDDADHSGVVLAENPPATVSEVRRRTEDDLLDLDYEEDGSTGGALDEKKSESDRNSTEGGEDGELTNDSSVQPEKPADAPEKEEGELEDGELTSSDDEQPPPPPPQPKRESSSNNSKSSISNRSPPRRSRQPTKGGSTGTGTSESAWERGLREAREAMRRASKVREEPDFDKKRLVAAPTVRRSSRNNTDSDRSQSPTPAFRPRKHSRSPPSPRRIPSLLDLRMSPPSRRIAPKELLSSRALRPVTRRSPSYSSPSKEKAVERDLGPQVIYPNGRPCPKREPESQRDRNRDRDRRRSPRRDNRQSGSNKKRERRSPPAKKLRTDAGFDRNKRKPSMEASPISSDTDSATPEHSKKGNLKANRDLSAVSDPWARKKKKVDEEKMRSEKRRRRSSSSSSSSSTSTITGRRKSRRSTTVSSSGSEADKRKASPPRGDISHYRIPKKKVRDREEDPIDDFFARKKTDVPAAFRNKRPSRKSDSESDQEPTKAMEAISSSESEDERRRSRSRTSSSSSAASSRSRTPARYRVNTARSPSPVSEASGPATPKPPPPEDDEPVPAPPSPPKADSPNGSDPEHNRQRKLELLEQLREVEEELGRKRHTMSVETAH